MHVIDVAYPPLTNKITCGSVLWCVCVCVCVVCVLWCVSLSVCCAGRATRTGLWRILIHAQARTCKQACARTHTQCTTRTRTHASTHTHARMLARWPAPAHACVQTCPHLALACASPPSSPLPHTHTHTRTDARPRARTRAHTYQSMSADCTMPNIRGGTSI